MQPRKHESTKKNAKSYLSSWSRVFVANNVGITERLGFVQQMSA